MNLLDDVRALEVHVPIAPVPKARARTTGRGTATPRRTVEFEASLCRALAEARRRIGWPERYAGRVSVEIVMSGPPSNADGDNVEKSVMDALVAARVVYDDCTRYVVACSWRVVEGEPGVSITVYDEERRNR